MIKVKNQLFKTQIKKDLLLKTFIKINNNNNNQFNKFPS